MNIRVGPAATGAWQARHSPGSARVAHVEMAGRLGGPPQRCRGRATRSLAEVIMDSVAEW